MSTRLIREALPEEMPLVRELFLEYAASLNFDLGFQNFEDELATLPGKYARPEGCILLAFLDDAPVGCVAMRPFEGSRCEMKRLYLRPCSRGYGLGSELLQRFLKEARDAHYQSVVLDTIQPLMSEAISLYKRVGFREIPPYRPNPIRGALYLELALE